MASLRVVLILCLVCLLVLMVPVMYHCFLLDHTISRKSKMIPDELVDCLLLPCLSLIPVVDFFTIVYMVRLPCILAVCFVDVS